MAYSPTVYVNDSTPAVSAENLNKSEEELVKLDAGQDSLNNALNRLPNEVGYGVVPTAATTINNKYIERGTGAIKNANGIKVSDFIAIPEGAINFCFDGGLKTNQYAMLIAFYESNSASTYIAGSGCNLNGQSSVIVSIPKKAKYYVIGDNATSSGNIGVLSKSLCYTSDIYLSLDSINDEIYTGITSGDPILFSWIAGMGAYSSNGNIGGNISTATTSNSRYAVINIQGGKKYNFKGYYTKQALYVPIIWVDENNKVVGFDFSDRTGKNINDPIPETVIVAPETATKVYINSTTDGTNCVFKTATDVPISDTVVSNVQRIENLENETLDTRTKSLISKLSTMGDGDSIVQNTNFIGIRKNDTVSFYADITSFSSLNIGYTQGSASQGVKYFGIDNTNIYVYGNTGRVDETLPHGLTIENNIAFLIECTDTNTTNITLISNGTKYTHTINNFTKYPLATAFALSIGSSLENAVLSWTCKDINKKIWLFGDSYCDYLMTRWTYYLHQYNFDKNTLISSVAGSGSSTAVTSITNLLNYATPKYAIWCMGMNDGSDTNDTTPSSAWVTGRDSFIALCNNYGITPIFATIPNVPSISHIGKNKWIKESGYRYIDFADSVGANSEGSEWYSGMLNTDQVHPTAKGAIALFSSVLSDFPEIMIETE